ncbi:hypothetical protein N0V82_001186 [Gnomoniopsis sp. IMI 355080]|nr:hypothetical protein N0V82_001186 [Gnomoniopsis sp. IMI 355080]
MSSNQTVTNGGAVLTQVIDATTTSLNGVNRAGWIVTGVVVAFALLLRRLSSVPMDPREPPLIKTYIPYYGFFLGLYRKHMDYFDLISDGRHSVLLTMISKWRPRNRGIATVQFLDNKTYVAWSPAIIQACMRHKNMSIEQMSTGFSSRVFGMHHPQDDSPPAEDPEPIQQQGDGPPKRDVLSGPPLFQMNVRALGTVADVFNGIPADASMDIPNLYRWLRRHVTLATMDGILGMNNPFRTDPSLVDALFEWEGKRAALVFGHTLLKFLPGGGTLGSRDSFEAREIIHRRVVEYFDAQYEQRDDVSAIIKLTTGYFRYKGMDNDELARNIMPIIWVSTVNTIPTMYWFFTNVLLRPQLVERLRAELDADKSETPVLKVTQDKNGKRTSASINITQLEAKCPLLVSCYRETIRLANQLFGLRMVDKDVTVSDEDGTTYFLKQGHTVIWSAKSMHRADSIWGHANEFDPDRFTPEREAEKEARQRKQSYIPFGGGKHLCPGRHFAFAENLGFLAAMIVGFEVHGLKQENVRMGFGRVNDAITQPSPEGEGGQVSISRRAGWENVEWSYEC